MKNKLKVTTLIVLGILLVPAHLTSAAGSGWPFSKKSEKRKDAESKKGKDEKKKGNQPAEPGFSQSRLDDEAIARLKSRPANGSLFQASGLGLDLLGDFRARRIGDLVFVDVVEGSTASVSSGAKRSRDSGTVGGLTTAIAALPGASAATVADVITAMGNRKYEGSGTTNRTTDLRGRIAARVIEVLPNGDLRIEAMKTVKINQETEKMLLSGIVRQRDLTNENVVPTTSVGDLYVSLNGKGMASNDNAPGWLFRFFDKISPF